MILARRISAGKYDKAGKWIDQILKEDPSNTDAKMLKAAAREKRLPDSLRDLRAQWEGKAGRI
jgi:hypothetical protein